jgi:hypothetical protein
MEDNTKALFNKCLRLFFFFQKKDAYETMMMHDYGFYEFQKYENYLDQKEKKEKAELEGEEFEEKTWLSTPLFESREQLVIHDECYQIMCSNFEFLGLRLKKKDIESKIGSKVIKPILRMYGYDLPSSKNDFDLEIYMRRKLTELFDNSANGVSLDEDKHKFIDQFR